MADHKLPITIVVAEDDPDDRFLIEDAFRENKIENEVQFVENGEELMAYLKREGEWEELRGRPLPGLILLDLNMPRMDGREALKLIKDDPVLASLPVVAFSTSGAAEDIEETYTAGVNSFISKPKTYDGLVQVVRVLNDYWIDIVRPPPVCDTRRY